MEIKEDWQMKIVKRFSGYNVILDNGFRLYDLNYNDLMRCLR